MSKSAVVGHVLFNHMTLILLTFSGILGVKIYNCNNNNKVEIFEDSPAPVTCGDITSTGDVVWRRGDGVNIGECNADGTCTTALYNDYSLRRSPVSTESQLTLVPDYRRHEGLTVTCHDMGSLATAICSLVIKSHSVLSDCQVTTDTVNWTVSGSCRVQKGFSSDNNYSCAWRINNEQETFGGFEASRELCSFTQALPQAGGLYTYSISVSPPANSTFSWDFRLVEPRNVTTSCPQVVARERDLICACLTTNTASPPATVRWEGRDSEKLVKTKVQREDNGTQFTCHVTWAGRVYTSINYTLLAAYGPSLVNITLESLLTLQNGSVVTLTCETSSDVYPGVSFFWAGVVCENSSHLLYSSTCTYTTNTTGDGGIVTCSVMNTAVSSILVIAIFVFNTTEGSNSSVFTEEPQVLDTNPQNVNVSGSTLCAFYPSNKEIKDTFSVWIIVGSATATGVLALIATVLIILYRQRKHRLKRPSVPESTYASPSRQEVREHVYMDVCHADPEYEIPVSR